MPSADRLNRQAIALGQAKRYDQALVTFLEALALSPEDRTIQANIGHLLLTAGLVPEAVAVFEQILAAEPTSALAHFNAAAAHRAAHQEAQAIALLRRALDLKPTYAAAHNNLASALAAIGDVSAAVRHWRLAIEQEPDNARFYHNLAHATRLAPTDPLVIHLAATEGAEPLYRHLALGKVFADAEQTALAVEHLRHGNELYRRDHPYDEAATLGYFATITAAYAAPLAVASPPAPARSPEAIFVVGMPRSGTSLIEQILASHPVVYGAGELDRLSELVKDFWPDGPKPPTAAQKAALAEGYYRTIAAFDPQAAWVVDKMPGNFFHVGLIQQAMPTAKIIHVRRDPLDTCFSCFMTLFSSGHAFTYDLAELGRYWRAYDTLMAHWQRVLPDGAMLTVDYEALVRDFEPQVRRMLAFCGLDWHDACRQFHTAQRAVNTASSVQVRQPLYQKPAGQWQEYAALLGF